VVQSYADAGGFLFGRRTYQNLAAYWPNASKEEQVIAEPLNTKPKYVASRTLAEPLEWQNSMLLRGDLAGPCAEEGRDLHVIGSSEFAQTLIEHDLVDQCRLISTPSSWVAASACSATAVPLKRLRLVESHATSTGGILATYAAAEGPA
jgi:dihydrofolate reductase